MTFGDWEQDGDVVVKKVTTIERMYITAPQDYDGLMIGIDVVTPPSDEEVLNLNSEDTIDDSELEYWDSFEERENWEFIRLTDVVDNGEASAE